MKPHSASLALSRMADHLLDHAAGDQDALIAALDIAQDLHRQRVQLAAIPEPVELDRTRKALTACIAERLVEVYNAPPHGGHQRAPVWSLGVQASPALIYLISPDWASDSEWNPIFRRRNFIALANFLMFV